MEKKIIEGKLVNIKAISIAIFAVIAVIADFIVFYRQYLFSLRKCAAWNWTRDWVVERYGENANVFTVTIKNSIRPIIFSTLIAAVIALIFFLIFNKTELTVTDKRVYGKTSWGKRVDLPFDSISAVGTAMMMSIAVTTASGAIKFALISNRDKVHAEISNLLIERQGKEKPFATTAIKQEIPQSNADELKKYKGLLDSGVISQEEFDAKKKQLLGL